MSPAPQPLSPSSNILPLDDVIPLARTLARKEAHTPDDIDDLVQVGLFAYHKAEHRYRECGFLVQQPWALVRTTLQRAMRGYYWQQREWQQRGELNKAVGLELAECGGSFGVAGLDGQRADTGQQVELLELEDYFTALERACGTAARRIVENLLSPSGECSAFILDEVRRKRVAQSRFRQHHLNMRHQPRGVKKAIRISHRLVRDALRITPAEWVRHMNQIREFTRSWIAQ